MITAKFLKYCIKIQLGMRPSYFR